MSNSYVEYLACHPFDTFCFLQKCIMHVVVIYNSLYRHAKNAYKPYHFAHLKVTHPSLQVKCPTNLSYLAAQAFLAQPHGHIASTPRSPFNNT